MRRETGTIGLISCTPLGCRGFYFRGKLEPLFAFAYSVNAEQPLILAQTYWHGLLFPNLDLFAGTVMWMG